MSKDLFSPLKNLNLRGFNLISFAVCLIGTAGLCYISGVVDPEYVRTNLSSDGILQSHTIRGIQVARVLVALAGLSIFPGYFLFIGNRDEARKVIVNHWLDFLPILILMVFMGIAALRPPLYVELIKEDGLIESGTFFVFMVSMILNYKILRFLGNGKPLAKIFYYLLFVGFFFGAMEEISWGQRIFNWSTPAYFATNNLQHEFNLHNIFSQEVVPIYWYPWLLFVSYGAGMPLIHKFQANRVSRLLEQNFLIPPLAMVPAFTALTIWVFLFYGELSEFLTSIVLLRWVFITQSHLQAFGKP